MDINPHGSVRGGSTLQIELQGLYNRKTAEVSDSFTALTLTHVDLPDDDTAQRHEMGWTSSLRKLQALATA